MLKNKDLHSEIEAIKKVIDTTKDPVEKAKLISATLNLKLLHNLRTNMVEVMRYFKIPLVKSKRRNDEDTKDIEKSEE